MASSSQNPGSTTLFKAGVDRFPRTTSVPNQRGGLNSTKPPLKLGTATFGVQKDLEG
jgi:hypothetical protein